MSKPKVSLIQQQKMLENNHNNNLFLTMDENEQKGYTQNKALPPHHKFNKLDTVQMPDHYSSISIFNKSKIFG